MFSLLDRIRYMKESNIDLIYPFNIIDEEKDIFKKEEIINKICNLKCKYPTLPVDKLYDEIFNMKLSDLEQDLNEGNDLEINKEYENQPIKRKSNEKDDENRNKRMK